MTPPFFATQYWHIKIVEIARIAGGCAIVNVSVIVQIANAPRTVDVENY